MGNRIENELCVMCGAPLMYPFNEYRTCSVCTEKVKKAQYEAKMHRNNKDARKTHLHVKVNRIYMPTRPLGIDT